MAGNGIKKRTALWKYFSVKANNCEISICLICAKEIPRTKANTTGMRDHLKVEHMDEWKDFEEVESKKKKVLQEAEENKKSLTILNQRPTTPITEFFDGKISR